MPSALSKKLQDLGPHAPEDFVELDGMLNHLRVQMRLDSQIAYLKTIIKECEQRELEDLPLNLIRIMLKAAEAP